MRADPAQARGLLVLLRRLARLRPLGQPAVLDAGDAHARRSSSRGSVPGSTSSTSAPAPASRRRGSSSRPTPRGSRCSTSLRISSRGRAPSRRSPRARSSAATPSSCRSRPTPPTATSRRAASSTGPTRSAASPRPTACCGRAGSRCSPGLCRRRTRWPGGSPTPGCSSPARRSTGPGSPPRASPTSRCDRCRPEWHRGRLRRRGRGAQARAGAVARRRSPSVAEAARRADDAAPLAALRGRLARGPRLRPRRPRADAARAAAPGLVRPLHPAVALRAPAHPHRDDPQRSGRLRAGGGRRRRGRRPARRPALHARSRRWSVNVFITGINQLEDVEIDRINKPFLPIAAGDLSPRAGRWIVAALGGRCRSRWRSRRGSSRSSRSLAGLLVGVAYSLPPLRLKRWPALAALSISGVRALVVNLGVAAALLALARGRDRDPRRRVGAHRVRRAVQRRDRAAEGRPRHRGRPPLPDRHLQRAARRARGAAGRARAARRSRTSGSRSRRRSCSTAGRRVPRRLAPRRARRAARSPRGAPTRRTGPSSRASTCSSGSCSSSST